MTKKNRTFQGWSTGILRKIIAWFGGTRSIRWQYTQHGKDAQERTGENRSSRYRDQRPTRLVPFSIAVVIFDNFHHFPAYSLLLLVLVEAVSGTYVVQPILSWENFAMTSGGITKVVIIRRLIILWCTILLFIVNCLQWQPEFS